MADLESITDSQFSVFRGLANPRTMDVDIQKTLPVKSRDDYTMKNYEAWRKTLDEVDVPAFDMLQRAARNDESYGRGESKRDVPEPSDRHDDAYGRSSDDMRGRNSDDAYGRSSDDMRGRSSDDAYGRRNDDAYGRSAGRSDEGTQDARHAFWASENRALGGSPAGPSYEMNQYVKKETQIDVSRKLAYLFDSAPKFPLTRELTVHSNPDDVHDEYVLMRRRRYVAAEKDKKVRQLLEMSNTAENVDKKLHGVLFQRGLTQAIADVLPEIDFYIEEDACERWVRNGGVSNPGAEIRNAVLRAMLSNTMRNFSGGSAAPVKSLANAPLFAGAEAVEPVPAVNTAMVDLQSHVESLSAMSRSMAPNDPRQQEVQAELFEISKAVSDDNQAEIMRLSQNKALRQKRMERAATDAAAREQRMQRLEAERVEQARRQEELKREAEMRQREAALKAEEMRRKEQIEAERRLAEHELQKAKEQFRETVEDERQKADERQRADERQKAIQELEVAAEKERLADAFITEQQAALARERLAIPEEIESDGDSMRSSASRASTLSNYEGSFVDVVMKPRQHDFDEEDTSDGEEKIDDDVETEVPEVYRAIINRRKPQRADDATTIVF